MLEANKKQVPLKSYSLEIRIDSVNQILKNKEKVKKTRNISMHTRMTDGKIPCVYIHVYRKTKNWGPGPYHSLRHNDNKRYFRVFLQREVKGKSIWLINSNMVKPEKFGHLHLVNHFTVPLNSCV